MITNKDISIDSENGKITLNGNKYDLGTQGEIDTAVKDVYTVMGQMGAKNLIIYPYYDPSGITNKGITYTYDKDGIITANGSTDNNQSSISLDDFSRGLVISANKKYTLTCEKTNDNNKGFAVLYFRNADNTSKTVSVHAVYEDGTTRNANSDYVSLLYNNVAHTSVTFWVDTDTIYITQARISINSGTITNAVLKPMLRLASDTDNTYEPYAMTNKQLTEQVTALDTKIGNKIKKLARRDLSYTCTSTNLEYTGLNVTCPASHAYIVRARLSFSSTAPSEILVSASSTSSSVYNRLAYGESGYATFLLLAGETAYVWGKWGATGENSASVEIIDITV